jgi:hypothetical protein
VVKEAEKKERRKEKIVVGREDQGREINREKGSWTTQQAGKAANEHFGAPRGKKEREAGEALKTRVQLT